MDAAVRTSRGGKKRKDKAMRAMHFLFLGPKSQPALVRACSHALLSSGPLQGAATFALVHRLGREEGDVVSHGRVSSGVLLLLLPPLNKGV